METRALAIAFFYAIGTAVGGISGSLLFDNLVKSGDRAPVSIALFVGTGVITLVGVIEVFFGVKAERANLEDIAMPLTAAENGRGSCRARGACGARARSVRERMWTDDI